MVYMSALVAFLAGEVQGAHGGHNGQSAIAGADDNNGSSSGDSGNSSGRVGHLGGTDPDKYGHLYLPGIREPRNPGPQDAEKAGSSRQRSAQIMQRFV